MEMPYEATGRSRQKRRTRDALVAAARELLTAGQNPTVEQTADSAGISRTTAYRYFPNQKALLLAVAPDVDRPSLLPPDPPADAAARLDLVVTGQTGILRDWEPQLRAALRVSLDRPPTDLDPAAAADRPALRQGRAIGWIEEALAPLADSHPDVDRQRLAVAIRAGCGIEAWVWLVDVAGVDRTEAATLMRQSAQAVLAAAQAAPRSWRTARPEN